MIIREMIKHVSMAYALQYLTILCVFNQKLAKGATITFAITKDKSSIKDNGS